ncbi:MAG: quinolinate synthase [Candidatus Saganbacteria bacterium]|uniref:Quinolinate synthase n=1 Tax=Candidatus Saganbacteria bacterium TaxID=2575572 RepID=A0A833L0C4_UNCSA|nr:MAG: quinolinate synthase [Candidatus Saganbacteria bacterium]
MTEILSRIAVLKKQRSAVILAHNYQAGDVQDIADYVGDSLGLSIAASKTTADVIIFCGVHFMAETAKILSPNKKVLMPDASSGCPMANMITAEKLIELKAKHKKAKVVCYVNTSAEVKAKSDICCTSANAQKVVEAIKDTDEIIFIPDKYLGLNTAAYAKGKKFIFWEGYCPIHMNILPEHILKLKKLHPKAISLVHPECRPETVKAADEALSTEGMMSFVKSSKALEFIIGTEVGMIYRLKKENPDKIFYPASELAVCPNMKKTTLEKILWSLEDLKTEIIVNEETAKRAKRAIEKMIEIGRQD